MSNRSIEILKYIKKYNSNTISNDVSKKFDYADILKLGIVLAELSEQKLLKRLTIIPGLDKKQLYIDISCHYSGSERVSKDKKFFTEVSALCGNQFSQLDLGLDLINGGSKKEGLKFVLKAAKQNNIIAQYYLAHKQRSKINKSDKRIWEKIEPNSEIRRFFENNNIRYKFPPINTNNIKSIKIEDNIDQNTVNTNIRKYFKTDDRRGNFSQNGLCAGYSLALMLFVVNDDVKGYFKSQSFLKNFDMSESDYETINKAREISTIINYLNNYRNSMVGDYKTELNRIFKDAGINNVEIYNEITIKHETGDLGYVSLQNDLKNTLEDEQKSMEENEIRSFYFSFPSRHGRHACTVIMTKDKIAFYDVNRSELQVSVSAEEFSKYFTMMIKKNVAQGKQDELKVDLLCMKRTDGNFNNKQINKLLGQEKIKNTITQKSAKSFIGGKSAKFWSKLPNTTSLKDRDKNDVEVKRRGKVRQPIRTVQSVLSDGSYIIATIIQLSMEGNVANLRSYLLLKKSKIQISNAIIKLARSNNTSKRDLEFLLSMDEAQSEIECSCRRLAKKASTKNIAALNKLFSIKNKVVDDIIEHMIINGAEGGKKAKTALRDILTQTNALVNLAEKNQLDKVLPYIEKAYGDKSKDILVEAIILMAEQGRTQAIENMFVKANFDEQEVNMICDRLSNNKIGFETFLDAINNLDWKPKKRLLRSKLEAVNDVYFDNVLSAVIDSSFGFGKKFLVNTMVKFAKDNKIAIIKKIFNSSVIKPTHWKKIFQNVFSNHNGKDIHADVRSYLVSLLAELYENQGTRHLFDKIYKSIAYPQVKQEVRDMVGDILQHRIERIEEQEVGDIVDSRLRVSRIGFFGVEKRSQDTKSEDQSIRRHIDDDNQEIAKLNKQNSLCSSKIPNSWREKKPCC